MTMAADSDDESPASLYRVLLDRFRSLEASHGKLTEQFDVLVQEQSKVKRKSESGDVASDSDWGCLPCDLSARSPFRSVLECMGHAVHVLSASSGEIIYCNRAAEKLYGWKSCEVLGETVADFLIDEEYYAPFRKIMQRLNSGQSWSGQFPFKKRSGEIFMAVVTKSPFYEDGGLVGVITVSSDAALFNNINSENLRTYQERANGQSRVQGLNLKKIQWHPRPQITSLPQIASSVSNLASKVLLRRRGDDMNNTCAISGDGKDTVPDTVNVNLEKSETLEAKPKLGLYNGKSTTEGRSFQKEESAFEFAQPSKIAAKLLSKLHIGGTGNTGKEKDGIIGQNDSTDTSVNNEEQNGPNSPRCSKATTSYQCTVDTEDKGENPCKKHSSLAAERAYLNVNVHRIPNACEGSSYVLTSSRKCHECFGVSRLGNPLPLSFESGPKLQHLKASEIEDAMLRQPDAKQFPSSGESVDSSPGSSSSRGDSESNSIVDCEILWEELHLGDEIGQGFYAVVYRGIWNGSDVAIKIFFQNEYREGILLDYKKEIDIISRLRHPNVLLFMGAVYSHERLAIVTEFLPRGSLFKTLHKNNQALDIRRRMRMALDVARGMNYLHHRNPPIVHRDLKSSNLLVDKNWTVKVGDFGLSRLKIGTFLTAKSGRGTPQWMAPEVLRNEPSNEKSDVFSFGVILWELMTESIPWVNLNSLQVVGVVGFMDRRLDLPESLDPQVSSVIHECWQSNQERRPSFEEIIQRMKEIIHKVAAMAGS